MPDPLQVRRYGTFCEVSYPNTPLSEQIIALLTPHMVYTHVTINRGADRYDYATGVERPVETTLVRLYSLSGGRLTTCYGYIPRIFSVLDAAGVAYQYQDLTPPPRRGEDVYTPLWDRLEGVEFRPRQQDCLRAISNSLGGVIDAPPAFGKSFVMTCLARLYPRAKIHIVIKGGDLVRRTVRELRQTLSSVGQVGLGKHETDCRVTVFSADSLHRSDGDADFLLCDEAHQLVTFNYSEKIARTYGLTRNFAFTATPEGRIDNAHARLEYHFGPRIFQMSWQEAERHGLLVPLRVHWIRMNIQGNPAAGLKDTAKMRWGIWRNQERNLKFAEQLHQHGPEDQCLALVGTFEHAVYLWQHLPDYTLCYGQGCVDEERLISFKRHGLLPEDYQPVTTEIRERFRQQFEAKQLTKVIATDIWSTGVSFEQLAVVARLDATQSSIADTQAPGRAARIHTESGKEFGLIYDADDIWDDGFRNRSEKRYRNYASKGWEQYRNRRRVDV